MKTKELDAFMQEKVDAVLRGEDQRIQTNLLAGY